MCKTSPDRIARERFARIEKSRRDEISKLHNAKEEGREERNIEIAKNALKEGISLEITSKLTGLSIGYLKKLSKEDV